MEGERPAHDHAGTSPREDDGPGVMGIGGADRVVRSAPSMSVQEPLLFPERGSGRGGDGEGEMDDDEEVLSCIVKGVPRIHDWVQCNRSVRCLTCVGETGCVRVTAMRASVGKSTPAGLRRMIGGQSATVVRVSGFRRLRTRVPSYRHAHSLPPTRA